MATDSRDTTNLYAVVDMGSNGIRFSISDLSPPTARLMPILYQDRSGISLYDAQFSNQNGKDNGDDNGNSINATNSNRSPIPADTMETVIARLVQFQTTCHDFNVPTKNIYVLATEAMRTAPNSAEFRTLIRIRVGWEVSMLDQAEEGRIGALGVASSTHSIAGLAMDLGGGSTQITWVVEEKGVVTTSPRGSFSFPYGAAALKKRLEEARGRGKTAVRELREEMIRNFQGAYAQLEIPQALLDVAERKGGFDLYLCGGGFRGWGYLLMKQSLVEPYPIPIINGFRASREDFHDTVSVLDDLADSDAKIFGVSKRRISQIPSVAILVNVLMDALPAIKNVQFCQGGVREGFLFDKLPMEVREQDALLAATLPYAPPSSEAIRHLLLAALPTSSSPLSSLHTPDSFSTTLIAALANLLFAHSHVPRETRSAAALHCTTTGFLASANSLTHTDRAILALILCERWAGDLAPIDQVLHRCLRESVSTQEAWWCQYLGRVATLIGDVYPSGRVSETRWRIHLQTEWDSVVKKKESCDLLCLRVRCNRNNNENSRLSDHLLQERTERIEKSGRKKSWIGEYGVRVGISIVQ